MALGSICYSYGTPGPLVERPENQNTLAQGRYSRSTTAYVTCFAFRFLRVPTHRTLATRYDTLREELIKVTYKPPVFPQTMKGPVPRPASEADYLETIFKPRQNLLFPEVPTLGIEVYLHKELSNPHSRAKKQARWQAHQAYKKNLLKEYISVELKNLNGRTVGNAKAEAAWKWRQRLIEEEREKKKMRWKTKASIAKLDKKSERKERKELKQRERLTAMVLKEEPNQVIPEDMR